MCKRRLSITIPALLLVSLLIFLTGVMTPVSSENAPKTTKLDAELTLRAINSRNSPVKTIFCPNITMGFISNSSLFYDKEGDLLFSTWILGTKEAVVGCKGNKYWFWMRSFDKKNIYVCDKQKLNETNLRPLMRPEVISMIGWCTEIDSELTIHESKNGFFVEIKKGSFTKIIEFDAEKILLQKVISNGQEIVTMEGKEYTNFSGIMLPKRIKVIWHEENKSSEFSIKQWIINEKGPDTSGPKGMNEINLEEIEDCSSSSKISVSFSFSPVLGGR